MGAPVHFAETIAEDYGLGREYYGEIGIAANSFVDYVWSIVCKYLKDCPDELGAIQFAKQLYLRDVYLACGCVQRSESAWTAFDARYRKFITDLVRYCYRRGSDPEEQADAVMVSLYFPDRSGRQRMASYDGRSSLATWLRVIVTNRMINRSHERHETNDNEMVDVPDTRPLATIDSALHAERYERAFTEALTKAFKQLSAKERLMLLWRYEQNLQLGQIAKLLNIHQSNVTRQLVRLQARLRDSVLTALAVEHRMGAQAIQECIGDIIHNPQVSNSLLHLMKGAPGTVAASTFTFSDIPRKRAC